ncbi:Tm-1-like ATP-binding domain-containing protein [Roseovarius sp. 2305UL8-3]|uniref:Tm-1-like ATP-binding domain-containing protein n=1 Tax=Roseovarius conchicola TaxID=3121636 RepID=UPI003527F595
MRLVSVMGETETLSNTDKNIVILATLDSKGEEAAFLKRRLASLGRSVLVVDVGTSGEPRVQADISSSEVKERITGDTQSSDPAKALAAMAEGAAVLINDMFEAGTIDAVVGIGGGKGAGLFHQATKGLPFGFPKVLISSGRPALLAEIATTSDTILMPTLVDLFGINRFSRAVLENAANLVSGLVWHAQEAEDEKTIAVTAFGVTTPAVAEIKRILDRAGYTVIVFPANGAGGRTMEVLIARGVFDGVIDLTTTEIADLVFGGTASAGADRLLAAGAKGIPHLIAPGAVDMVNFGPPETVPNQFSDRITYRHTPMTTLVRTTPADMAEIARHTAQKVNAAQGPVAVFWPGKGVSDYDREGHDFHNPSANAAWRDAMMAALSPSIQVTETDHHINDPAFAALCADWMMTQLERAT